MHHVDTDRKAVSQKHRILTCNCGGHQLIGVVLVVVSPIVLVFVAFVVLVVGDWSLLDCGLVI